jgi:UDP-N-acetylglucosamine 2-epimerase (non-hydrolysing)
VSKVSFAESVDSGRREKRPANRPARSVDLNGGTEDGKACRTSARFRISVVFGTRPEAIKLAPVILALKADPAFECHVCVTAQHREMLDQVLEVFEIKPDADLNLMRPNQSLNGLTARLLETLDAYLEQQAPELVLVQGDTTTAFSAALAAFHRQVPVGHVEAGLRTGNLKAPWPEEANRVLTTRLANLHFAPTKTARDQLLREGIRKETIFLTGNTVIDALLLALKKIEAQPPFIPGLPAFLQPSRSNGDGGLPMVLITGHRRENFGEGFEAICLAIAELARRFRNVHFVYPVHLNPNVREPVGRILGETLSSDRRNVYLIEPLPYLAFVALMERATFILTDSGGIQEEAPSRGKPVLVMRDSTERPEAVKSGNAKLVGANRRRIVEESARLLCDRTAFEAMAHAANPFGDGKAAQRIVEASRCLMSSIRCPA